MKSENAQWLRDYDGDNEMPIIAKDTGTGGDFEIAPEGTHQAICNMVAYLGHQKTTYQGVENIKEQVYLRFELPHERVEFERDGTKTEGPMAIGKTYTLSLSEKANLRKDLQAWRGKRFTDEELEGFDIENLLGVPCQVTVTHKTAQNGKTYANIVSLAGWPKGMEKPKPENELISWNGKGDMSKLPKWIQEKWSDRVDASDEGSYEQYPEASQDEFDSDVPF